MRHYASFAIGAVVLLAPFAASSHFFLLEPTSTLVQNNLGDPQKLAPCGDRINRMIPEPPPTRLPKRAVATCSTSRSAKRFSTRATIERPWQ